MKVVIAGSRQVRDIWIVDAAIRHSGFPISHIIQGEAEGVDTLARLWAENNDVSCSSYPADWSNSEGRPDAVMRRRRDGQWYDVTAGHRRNVQMADAADAAILVWDWKSRGTLHMIRTCLDRPIFVFIYRTYGW